MNAPGAGLLRVSSESTLKINLTNATDGANSRVLLTTLDLRARTLIDPVFTDGFLSPGAYVLFEYSELRGEIEHLVYDMTADIGTGVPTDPRYSITVRDDAANKRVLLNVATNNPGGLLVWLGADDGTGVSEWSTDMVNFTDQLASDVSYFPGDSALFDNSSLSQDVTVGIGALVGSVTFDNDAAHPYTVGGAPIYGEGWIEKRGTGTLLLTGDNAYNGVPQADGSRSAATILSRGVLAVGSDAALGRGSVLIRGTESTLQAARDGLVLANDIGLSGATSARVDTQEHTLTLGGKLAGDASTTLTKIGQGVLVLTGPGGASFLGQVAVSQGVLLFNDADLSKALINLSQPSAILDVEGLSAAGALIGVGGSRVTGSGVLEVGGRGETGSFAGSLEGAVTLAKTGAGTLTLTGDNSNRQGALIARSGHLEITGPLGDGALQVESGAFIVLNLAADTLLTQEISGAGTLEKRDNRTHTISSANEGFSGSASVLSGTLVLTDAGTLGTASVDIAGSGRLLLVKPDGASFNSDFTGGGVVVKSGSGTLALGGNGSARLEVQVGTVLLDGAGAGEVQTLSGRTTLASGTVLLLNPAEDGVLSVADIVAAGAGRVEKTGDGLAQLTGLVEVPGGVLVRQGELAFGDGTGNSLVQVTGPVDVVSAAATLSFARQGETQLAGALTSIGTIHVTGGSTGEGTVVLLNAANRLSGELTLENKTVLQVGDSGHAASLTSPGEGLSATLAPGATLRFAQTVGNETGSALTLSGEGTIEQAGDGALRFNSTAPEFTGTFLASAGTFTIGANALPSGASVNATGTGNLRLEAAGTATFDPTRLGSGNGVITLGASSAGGSATYALAASGEVNRFNGIIAVDANTTLNLPKSVSEATTTVLNTKELHVLSGGLLSGSGTVQGTLNNAAGGLVRPGGSQLQPGRIDIKGDFINAGVQVVNVDSALNVSTLHYTGVAYFEPTALLRVVVSEEAYAKMSSGAGIKFLVDDNPTNGVAQDVSGIYDRGNIEVWVLQPNGDPVVKAGVGRPYDFGDGGITLRIVDSIVDLTEYRINRRLDGFVRYLKELRDDTTVTPESRLLAEALLEGDAGLNVRRGIQLIEGASPLGLSALTAMTIDMVHQDMGNLHDHLEGLRYLHTSKERFETQAYVQTSAGFTRNGGGADSPAFDYDIYGGSAGFDWAVGNRVILGVAAGYHHGRATLEGGAGKVNEDNGQLSTYGTFRINDFLYLDAMLFAGYSGYDVKHTTRGTPETSKAKPAGYDLGGAIYGGGVLPLTKALHFTPYLGLEYAYAEVDDFSERGGSNAAALRVNGFEQSSLRLKVGTGLSWLLPSKLTRTLRLSLDVSYARELLDSDVDITARFARDNRAGTGFSVRAPSTPENSVQIGPSVEFGFTDRMTLQFSYRLEHDLKKESAHHLNAAFRMRF
jgi:uncharacterized protein with beta-barrel porin domain